METWRSLLHSTSAACQQDKLLIEFSVEVDKIVTTKLSTVTVYLNIGPIYRRIINTSKQLCYLELSCRLFVDSR